MWWNLINIRSVKHHLLIAFLLRMVLIIYSDLYHDRVSEVPYTDIDYTVFTDASRHILNLKSPYERHTFRYTPLVALLLLPNILVHKTFGKYLFSIIDLIVGLLIRAIVSYNRRKYCIERAVLRLKIKQSQQIINDDEPSTKTKIKTRQITDGRVRIRKRNKTRTRIEEEERKPVNRNKAELDVEDHVADYCMLFWIYNPMSIIISTRGNCDSIAAFLVLLTLYLLHCKDNYLLAGLIHGLAIHVRLYPLVYTLSMYMYLSTFSQYSIDRRITLLDDAHSNYKQRKTIFKKQYIFYLVPNKQQLLFILGCLLSLVTLTALFYHLYGQQFVYESYLYHLIRKDTRHNFSMFFYIQYLTAAVKHIGHWQKVLSVLPQLVLLLVLSVRYGLNKCTLPFSILTQTIVLVAYNSVLTSQYFIWIIAVLPLTLWQFKMTRRTCIILLVIWFAAQLAWLLPAYLLEFHGQNTFIFIWLQSVSFFCANMAILGRLIKCYMYTN